MRTLELNLGERILINDMAAGTRGTSAVMRTVKRVRHAIAHRELPDQLTFGEIAAKDLELRQCEFADDAFEWLRDTVAAKSDWIGSWADWVDTLVEKLTTQRMNSG